MRVGWGFDAHRFAPSGSVLLAGVTVDADRGVAATSDGDVLAHAVADALLGAAGLGDLGSVFPSSDPAWQDADSMALLADVAVRVRSAGWAPASVDATVLLEATPVAPHRDAIRAALSTVLGLREAEVSVKATTTDGMGFIGRDEGIAAVAIVVVEPVSHPADGGVPERRASERGG